MQLFNEQGQYVEKFIGDANLSKSGLQYVLSNQIAPLPRNPMLLTT